MSEAEDSLSRQGKKAAPFSLASDLLADGYPTAHVESRLVNEGWSTEEAHEIVSALQAASQRADIMNRGLDFDGRPSKYADNQHRCRPPTVATLVKCHRCGQEYESSRIEERVQGDAEGGPQWCCRACNESCVRNVD
jgi:hypothetical protein